ncbi:type II toxin-antitoxin system death-on-curing family toxin [Candidatus Gracilibacteria bacterium]|nr:type II toxin-antitoxin system death-on-curing family toxin [Candidatus Gracilibacteria bacterium]
MKITYLDKQLFLSIFEIIQEASLRYAESAPDYKHEAGLVAFKGVCERIKEDDYYPDIFSKSAYLFLSIAKGHFFSNGNKRLAVASMFAFLLLNSYKINEKNATKVAQKFIKDHKISHRLFFYHLAKFAVCSQKDFDTLKTVIKNILQDVFEKGN